MKQLHSSLFEDLYPHLPLLQCVFGELILSNTCHIEETQETEHVVKRIEDAGECAFFVGVSPTAA